MIINRIKIETYIFEKDEGEMWVCRNHNLMSGDMANLNEIMPKLKQIEELLKTKDEKVKKE